MTLPVNPNPISLNQVNVELGLSGTAQVSLNDSAVRTLAGVPSGEISLPDDFWGKSANKYAGTITQGYYNDSPNFPETTVIGFSLTDYGIGSRSPTTLSDGKTLIEAYDFYFTPGISGARLRVSGFSSDPTASYITSAQRSGSSALLGSAATYSYVGGTASWEWTGSSFGFISAGAVGFTIL